MKIIIALYFILISNVFAQNTCRDLLLEIYNKNLPEKLKEAKSARFEKGVYLWVDSKDLGDARSELVKIEYIETLEEVDHLGKTVKFSVIRRLDTDEVIKYEMSQALGNFLASPQRLKRVLIPGEIVVIESTSHENWRVIKGHLSDNFSALDIHNARFLKNYDEEHSVIKILKHNEEYIVVIPNESIKPFQNSGEKDFLGKLNSLIDIKIDLDNQVGKLIRYRRKGKIEVDILEKIEGNFGIIKSNPNNIKISLDKIYIVSEDYMNTYTPKEIKFIDRSLNLNEMTYDYENSPLTIQS